MLQRLVSTCPTDLFQHVWPLAPRCVHRLCLCLRLCLTGAFLLSATCPRAYARCTALHVHIHTCKHSIHASICVWYILHARPLSWPSPTSARACVGLILCITRVKPRLAVSGQGRITLPLALALVLALHGHSTCIGPGAASMAGQERRRPIHDDVAALSTHRRHAVPCRAMLCHAMPCSAMPPSPCLPTRNTQPTDTKPPRHPARPTHASLLSGIHVYTGGAEWVTHRLFFFPFCPPPTLKPS